MLLVVSVMLNVSPAAPAPGGEEIVVITRSGRPDDPIVMVLADAMQLLFSLLSAICDVRPPVPGPESAQATTEYVPCGVPERIVMVVVAVSVPFAFKAPTLRVLR